MTSLIDSAQSTAGISNTDGCVSVCGWVIKCIDKVSCSQMILLQTSFTNKPTMMVMMVPTTTTTVDVIHAPGHGSQRMPCPANKQSTLWPQTAHWLLPNIFEDCSLYTNSNPVGRSPYHQDVAQPADR